MPNEYGLEFGLLKLLIIYFYVWVQIPKLNYMEHLCGMNILYTNNFYVLLYIYIFGCKSQNFYCGIFDANFKINIFIYFKWYIV